MTTNKQTKRLNREALLKAYRAAQRESDWASNDCAHWDYVDPAPHANHACCERLRTAQARVTKAREAYQAQFKPA